MIFGAPEIFGKVRGAKIMPFLPNIYSLGLITGWMMIKEIPDILDIY